MSDQSSSMRILLESVLYRPHYWFPVMLIRQQSMIIQVFLVSLGISNQYISHMLL